MIKKMLKAFHEKLWIESLIKSLIYGSIAGFSTAFMLAFIFFFTKTNGIWLIIGTFVFITALATFICKKWLFQTSIKTTAARLDKDFHLNERAITMVEYENEDRLVIQKQRENASEKIKFISPKQLRFVNMLKPLLILGIISVLMISMTIVTSLSVRASIDDPGQFDDPIEQTEDEHIIEALIEDLRNIVNHANIEETLRSDLHAIIDQLEIDIAQDQTLDRKIARIEDTRREILELIVASTQERTTIIDEMKTHETTAALGFAFEDGSEAVINETIEQIVDDFLELDISAMKQYLRQLTDEIEQSVDDADIKDNELEEDLADIIQRLRDLIPKLEGDIPDEFGDQLSDLLTELGQSLNTQPSEETSEEISETIQEAIDELEEMQEEEDEDDPEESENEGVGEEENEGSGSGLPAENPVIIDGETEYTYEIFEQIKDQMIDMLASGEITEDELITLVNQYMDNIEKTQTASETDAD